jgi:titin
VRGLGGALDGTSNVVETIAATPSVPADVTAKVAAHGEIRLYWIDTAINESSYKIERSTDGVNYTQIDIEYPRNTVFRDLLLSEGTQYWYRMRAHNGSGDSDYSNVVTTIFSPPAAPAELTATVVSAAGVRLDWVDTANNEKSFQVEHSLDGVHFSPIARVDRDVQSHTITDLATDTVHHFRVRAHNGLGNSDYSNIVSANVSANEQPPPATTPAAGVVFEALAQQPEGDGTNLQQTTRFELQGSGLEHRLLSEDDGEEGLLQPGGGDGSQVTG